MSYATEIAKTEQPESAELFKIIIGGVPTLFFTSGIMPVVFQGHSYTPVPIKRGHFAVERSLKAIKVSIALPVSDAFGAYIASAPYNSTRIEIWRAFTSNPDSSAKMIFIGRVQSIQISNYVANVTCQSSSSGLARKFPGIFYQTTCNHMIFDRGCGLVKGAFALPVVVSGAVGTVLTIPDISAFPDNAFQGGTMAYLQEERLITAQVGIEVTILIPFTASDMENAEVTLYPGCDGTAGTCRGYDNEANFLGMPYIPTRNPILWGFR